MLRRASLLVLLGLLTDVHPSDAAWTPLTTLPEASFGAGAASQGGRLYLVGGFTTQISPSVVAWDGITWGSVAPLSQARMTAGVASTQASVFAFGGLDENGMASATSEKFDPLAGTWSGVAAMPVARASGAAGAIGELLYVAGGQGDDGLPLAACFRFDPGANAWSSVAALPTPRTGVAGAVLERRLWVIGGFDGMPSDLVERFDPQSGSWSAGPALPEPLWFPAAGVLDGRVWVVGGMDASFQRSDRVYSAGSDGVWRSEDVLLGAVAVTSAGSLSNCLVVAGGMDAAGMPSTMAISQCAASSPPPPPPSDSLTVALSLNPTTLNASSNGQWVSAHIVPNGWSATDILVGSLRLDGVAPDLTGPVSVSSTDVSVKFPRTAFADRPSGLYDLRLTGLTVDGSTFSGTTSLNVQGSSLSSKRGRGLKPLSSGPASSGVVVSLDQAEPVRIDVLDLQGRVVARIYQGLMAAGESRHEWPRAGQSVPRGTYFVRLARLTGTEVVRIAVLR